MFEQSRILISPLVRQLIFLERTVLKYQHMQHTSGKLRRALTHLLKVKRHSSLRLKLRTQGFFRICHNLAPNVSHSRCVRVGTGETKTNENLKFFRK